MSWRAADILDALPVALRRGDDAAAGGDRLEADRADGVRPLAQDDLLDRIGGRLAVVLRRAVLVAVFQAMRNLDEARRQGTILHGPLRLAAGRKRRDGRAVIVALAVEDLVLAPAVMPMRDLAHHLEDLLVGLRAGVGIIDPAHARHLLDQLAGKQRAGDGAGRIGEIVHLHQLVAHRVGNALAPVADIDRPHAAGHGIEMFLAGGVPDTHAAPLDDDARVDRLEHLVLDEMVPEMRAIGLDDISNIVGLNVHDVPRLVVSDRFATSEFPGPEPWHKCDASNMPTCRQE